ncbi:MAG: hypothetical protein ACR2GH_01195 [Pseudonocardia sp.]
MNTTRTPCPSAGFTTVRLDDTHEMPVAQVHRRWTPADYTLDGVGSSEREPQLSLDDVAATLFTSEAFSADELDDDATVRWLVAELVAGEGSAGVQERCCRLGETRLDTAGAARLAYCRHRAATVFGTRTEASRPAGHDTSPTVPTARRELVS